MPQAQLVSIGIVALGSVSSIPHGLSIISEYKGVPQQYTLAACPVPPEKVAISPVKPFLTLTPEFPGELGLTMWLQQPQQLKKKRAVESL
jgi:hypothetical protein|tara:strand:- start:500 stop:769 length:270 start_codon:yes stop_codon:yes gene_type:complete